MTPSYVQWQFIVAPVWLATMLWNVQRAVWQFFSVPYMLRTFVSHWHRDAVSYRQGSLGGMLQAFAWNMISRGIGVVIRSFVLLTWILTELVCFIGAITLFVLFLAWPLVTLTLIAAGIVLTFGL